MYGNTTGETYLTGELVHLCHHSYFHPSEESTDIGTKKQKRSRQSYYGRNPGPVGMRTSSLTYELSQRNQKCPGQSHRPRLPMSGHHCWLFAMLQSTAKSGRHHKLCAELLATYYSLEDVHPDGEEVHLFCHSFLQLWKEGTNIGKTPTTQLGMKTRCSGYACHCSDH